MVRKYPLTERRRSSAMSDDLDEDDLDDDWPDTRTDEEIAEEIYADNNKVKWQYQFVDIALLHPDTFTYNRWDVERSFNKYGEDGWEFCGFAKSDAIFKRKTIKKSNNEKWGIEEPI